MALRRLITTICLPQCLFVFKAKNFTIFQFFQASSILSLKTKFILQIRCGDFNILVNLNSVLFQSLISTIYFEISIYREALLLKNLSTSFVDFCWFRRLALISLFFRWFNAYSSPIFADFPGLLHISPIFADYSYSTAYFADFRLFFLFYCVFHGFLRNSARSSFFICVNRYFYSKFFPSSKNTDLNFILPPKKKR